MKKSFLISTLLLVIATACSTGKTESSAEEARESAQPQEVSADIQGQWYLENIVFSDSVFVRPSEEVPGVRQYITFNADSSYYIHTNCNSLSGSYSLHGDSITIGDGMMTEMACDNMATEDALRKILPHIATVDVENDSVMRLNASESSEYIVLIKAKEKK